MDLNFFLWPMIIPMIIPLFYCIKYKKESLKEIIAIILSIILIIITYWPLSNIITTSQNIVVKFILFIILPIIILYIFNREKSAFDLKNYGIKKVGLNKSIIFSMIFLPIMLLATFVIKYVGVVTYDADLIGGTISFFESFSEEFFFRGILFIYLLSKTNIKIAYITSLTCFILMHPQHLENYKNLFFIATIIQGFLTIEIARRSENIIGAWILHGVNRFFGIAIIPLLLN